jgi:hypothetical protein
MDLSPTAGFLSGPVPCPPCSISVAQVVISTLAVVPSLQVRRNVTKVVLRVLASTSTSTQESLS